MRDAPASARLIEAFANTVDVKLGTDELDSADGLATWLAERGILDRAHQVGAADHGLCLRLRAGIREELGVNVGDGADPALRAGTEEALRELPVLVSVGRSDGGSLSSAPHLPPTRRALAELAIAWCELALTGEAARLKRCSEHTCAWVFWDASKNRSRRWCSMRVCGNRAKARRHSAKQTGATGPTTRGA
ncbi:CGNR zinc finger domain-containing protein [Streptomyces sp. NPDC006925]|uniref:CGNR zinc finger domain-containing protein n=1 Tax=Streptomyces sp. NPDC006925 TaxID=3364768 RepID=UPI0036C3F00B